MDRKSKLTHPSFFKIMVGDFSTKLRVPPAFKNNFKQKNLPMNFTFSLRSVVGISWKVKVERSRSGFYYFTRGWSDIVKDLQLVGKEFLVFYLVADDAFQLAIFDKTCCEKSLNFSTPATSDGNGNGIERSEDNLELDSNYEDEDDDGQEEEEENEDGEEGIVVEPDMPTSRKNGCHGKAKQRNAEVKVTREEAEKEVIGKKKSHFVKFTRPASTRSFCVLPVWFAEEIHQVCNDDEVLIKDPVGREWVVKMKYRASPNRRYDLTTGWKEFRNANKLAVGDTLEFKHIKGCTIAVKVLPK